MAEILELREAETAFLQPYLPPTSRKESSAIAHESQNSGETMRPEGSDRLVSSPARPFVTLTYACSLDSMISLVPGMRTTLSGPETKGMTHYLRLHHDSILVGVGTAVADDPALNCRYPGATLETQPQPIVLDPGARWDVAKAKVSHLAQEGKGKLPWIIQAAQKFDSSRHLTPGCERLSIDDDGLFPATVSSNTSLNGESQKVHWKGVLKALTQKGVKSVMIEGGATVINDLLSHPELVDTVIITIAPTFLGKGGISVSPAPRVENGERINAARLDNTVWRQFGQDVVLCGRLHPDDQA